MVVEVWDVEGEVAVEGEEAAGGGGEEGGGHLVADGERSPLTGLLFPSSSCPSSAEGTRVLGCESSGQTFICSSLYVDDIHHVWQWSVCGARGTL